MTCPLDAVLDAVERGDTPLVIWPREREQRWMHVWIPEPDGGTDECAHVGEGGRRVGGDPPGDGPPSRHAMMSQEPDPDTGLVLVWRPRWRTPTRGPWAGRRVLIWVAAWVPRESSESTPLNIR